MEKQEWVIIRTYSAGVHFGKLVSEEKCEGGYHVILENTRRIWKWSGANSLSELASMGTSNPAECNFSMPVTKNKMFAIEIISMTEEAIENIKAVPSWVFSKDSEKVAKIIEKINNFEEAN